MSEDREILNAFLKSLKASCTSPNQDLNTRGNKKQKYANRTIMPCENQEKEKSSRPPKRSAPRPSASQSPCEFQPSCRCSWLLWQ